MKETRKEKTGKKRGWKEDTLSREESRTKDCCVFEDKGRRRLQRQGPR